MADDSRAALTGEKFGEAERSRQSYVEGLSVANQIAQASFFSQFPELTNVVPEHLALKCEAGIYGRAGA